MLATVEESTRRGFDIAVRSGRLLVQDLARSTIIALATAAALSAAGVTVSLGAEGSLDTLRFGTVRSHVIALTAASHPDDRKPCKLSAAPAAMLSSEAGLAILAV